MDVNQIKKMFGYMMSGELIEYKSIRRVVVRECALFGASGVSEIKNV